ALRVDGNRFVDAAGQPVQLRGASIRVLESWLVQGHDPTTPWGGQPNGNTTEPPDFRAMTTQWFMNVVRLPLNEASWLGLTCVDLGGAYGRTPGSLVRADPLGNYKSTVQLAVAAAHAAGLYVILDLHWAAPGNVCPVGPNAFANADHSLDFWTSVANTFKANPAVLFEVFHAPLPVGLASSADDWALWSGVFSPAGSFDHLYVYGPEPKAPTSYHWNATSMQALVHAIRGTGASNVILIAGENAAGNLSGWLTGGTASVFDMLSPPQLAAVWHAYPGSNNYSAAEYLTPLNQTNLSITGPSPALAQRLGTVAGPVFSQLRDILDAGYPVIITEYGDQNATAAQPGQALSSAAPFAAEILQFADYPGAANQARISYVAWSFNTNTNLSNTLLQPPPNTTATASPGFGEYVQSHYQCRAAGELDCE
ncbi:MAG: cellulase family glycosylhydrolase, partial [Rhodoferax sp.]|nr:cellulase family glycosylhydrolase [Rhodoferax sp.]